MASQRRASRICVNDRVSVPLGSALYVGGVARFIGRLRDGGRTYIGVELDDPVGENNGRDLFACEDLHGIVMPIAQASKERDGVGAPLTATSPLLEILEFTQGEATLRSDPSDQLFVSFRPSRDLSFMEFMHKFPLEMLQFLRALSEYMHTTLKEDNFHLRISPFESSFVAEAFYGEERHGPHDRKRRACLSCPGSEAGPLFNLSSSDTMSSWMDAKGRDMFVVTPRRHCHALRDLDDAELLDMFMMAADYLRKDPGVRFASLKVNHGTYRNMEHLHLKISMPRQDYRRMLDVCGTDERARLALIIQKRFEELADKPSRKKSSGPRKYA